MFEDLKKTWDGLDDETKKNVRTNLEDPNFVGDAIGEYFREMGADARAILGDGLEGIKRGLKALTEIEFKSPKKWAEDKQTDLDEERNDREMFSATRGAAKVAKDAVMGTIARVISGKKLESPRLAKVREGNVTQLEETLLKISEQTNAELPNSLNELIEDTNLLATVRDIGGYSSVIVNMAETDDDLRKRVDLMLATLNSNQEEKE